MHNRVLNFSIIKENLFGKSGSPKSPWQVNTVSMRSLSLSVSFSKPPQGNWEPRSFWDRAEPVK